MQRLGSRAVALEHFGSTSVPGCDGKPIIDVLVGLCEWPPPENVVQDLETMGYLNLGEAGVPGRLYLRRRAGPSLNTNLAVTLTNVVRCSATSVYSAVAEGSRG